MATRTRKTVALLLLGLVLLSGGVIFSRVRHGGAGAALYAAASYGREAEALALVEGGADVNFHNPEFGDTALHAASAGGFDTIAAALLSHGASINATSKFGSTPLHGAANRGRPSTVRMLLAQGANAQALNQFGRTPLQEAQGPLRLKHLPAAEREHYTQTVAILSAASGPAPSAPRP